MNLHVDLARDDDEDDERHTDDHIKAQAEVVLIIAHLVHQRMKEMRLVIARSGSLTFDDASLQPLLAAGAS